MLRILLIEDDASVRTAVRRMLARTKSNIVGEARNGATGVQLAQELQPDVVIVDGSLPDLDGVEVTRQVCSLIHPPRVIGFSATVENGSTMIKAGAFAFVSKSSPEGLVAAVESLLARGKE
jgi:NarL family two-component system response regulator LiaR